VQVELRPLMALATGTKLGDYEVTAPLGALPIAGLLTDLAARGLLSSTLVLWHGELGRMPISQRGLGRDMRLTDIYGIPIPQIVA
jgi:hypothetical protein